MQSFIIRPKNTRSKQQQTNYLVMSAKVYTIYKHEHVIANYKLHHN